MARRKRAAKKSACLISPKAAALSLGAIFAIWHLGWVLFVALGWGQAVLDWIQGMHFMTGTALTAFDATMVIPGLVGAFLCGAVTGWIFALIWNWVSK